MPFTDKLESSTKPSKCFIDVVHKVTSTIYDIYILLDFPVVKNKKVSRTLNQFKTEEQDSLESTIVNVQFSQFMTLSSNKTVTNCNVYKFWSWC